MKFWEAMKALEEGKKVRIKIWNSGEYCHIDGCNIGLGFFESMTGITTRNAINLEWEFYEEPVKTYTFQEIIPFLREGKRVKRSSWNNFEYILEMEVDGFIFNTRSGLILLIEDLEADDWIVVE